MAIQDWSEEIIMVELKDDPDFTDEVGQVIERVEREPRDVVLNFSQVKFLNSSNISRLLKLRKVSVDQKRRLVLCAIPVQVWGVFLLTGLDAVFSVAEDTASALAGLQMR